MIELYRFVSREPEQHQRDSLERLPVPRQRLKDVSEIVEDAVQSDAIFELHPRKLASLQDLLRTLPSKLMNANTRVHGLGI